MADKPEQQKCGEPRSEVNAVAARSGGNRLINIGKVCPVGRDALRRCFSGLWLFLQRESFGGSVGKHRVASVLNYQLVRNKCNKFSVGGLIVFPYTLNPKSLLMFSILPRVQLTSIA